MHTLKLAALATAVAGSAALAGPPPRAPDFTAHTPAPGVDHRLAASDGTTPIPPTDDVVFAPNDCSLDPNALLELNTAARWLTAHPRYRIVLEASADLPASPDRAEDLASRRAAMVRSHFMAWGVPSDRIVILVSRERGRRVVVYASDRPVQQIAAAALDFGRVAQAIWTDRGTLFQEEQGLGNEPHRQVIATRR